MIDLQRIVLSWHIGITITWYRVQQIADIIKLRLNERGVPDVGSRLSYCNYRAVIPIEKEECTPSRDRDDGHASPLCPVLCNCGDCLHRLQRWEYGKEFS